MEPWMTEKELELLNEYERLALRYLSRVNSLGRDSMPPLSEQQYCFDQLHHLVCISSNLADAFARKAIGQAQSSSITSETAFATGLLKKNATGASKARRRSGASRNQPSKPVDVNDALRFSQALSARNARRFANPSSAQSKSAKANLRKSKRRS